MVWIFAAIVAIFLFVKFAVGLVIIGEAQVGIVVKKIGKPLANHRFIATAGEAGYQAGTLAPGFPERRGRLQESWPRSRQIAGVHGAGNWPKGLQTLWTDCARARHTFEWVGPVGRSDAGAVDRGSRPRDAFR